jgi:hypothetical protein
MVCRQTFLGIKVPMEEPQRLNRLLALAQLLQNALAEQDDPESDALMVELQALIRRLDEQLEPTTPTHPGLHAVEDVDRGAGADGPTRASGGG